MSICADPKNCGFLGTARVGSMCDLENSAAICQDNGLRLGFVIAHQLGHTLVFTFVHSISFFSSLLNGCHQPKTSTRHFPRILMLFNKQSVFALWPRIALNSLAMCDILRILNNSYAWLMARYRHM